MQFLMSRLQPSAISCSCFSAWINSRGLPTEKQLNVFNTYLNDRRKMAWVAFQQAPIVKQYFIDLYGI
jgi:hypothetical protein